MIKILEITFLAVALGVPVVGFAAWLRWCWQLSRHHKRCDRAQREWEADCPRPRDAFANGGYHQWLNSDEAAEWLAKKPLPWQEEYRR